MKYVNLPTPAPCPACEQGSDEGTIKRTFWSFLLGRWF